MPPRPAASEPAAPQAASPWTASAKSFGFNAPASNPANLPRWQSPSTGGYGRTPSEDSRKRERATISERKPGLTPTYRELTWKEFDALGEEEQAAVQYNTLMRTAKDKDAELIKANDSDGNGHVTMRESKLARDKQAGYREGFKKTYGREATDDDVFAPNTLALLNGLEVSGIGGDLTEFTNESGLIRNTDLTDLKSNTNTNRTALVKALSSSSTRLSQALKSGATAQGVKIGTSRKKRIFFMKSMTRRSTSPRDPTHQPVRIPSATHARPAVPMTAMPAPGPLNKSSEAAPATNTAAEVVSRQSSLMAPSLHDST